jgi:hypothetical protein
MVVTACVGFFLVVCVCVCVCVLWLLGQLTQQRGSKLFPPDAVHVGSVGRVTSQRLSPATAACRVAETCVFYASFCYASCFCECGGETAHVKAMKQQSPVLCARDFDEGRIHFCADSRPLHC